MMVMRRVPARISRGTSAVLMPLPTAASSTRMVASLGVTSTKRRKSASLRGIVTDEAQAVAAMASVASEASRSRFIESP